MALEEELSPHQRKVLEQVRCSATWAPMELAREC
jgi:hypothetical protein